MCTSTSKCTCTYQISVVSILGFAYNSDTDIISN